MHFNFDDLSDDNKGFDYYKADGFLQDEFFFDQASYQNLSKMGEFDEAKGIAKDVLPLVAKSLQNGAAVIADDFGPDSGVTGVACQIADDVFYFHGNNSYDYLDDYLKGRDFTRIVADVSIGVMKLLYDDNGFNRVEGVFLISYMEKAFKNSLENRKGDYIKLDVVEQIDKAVNGILTGYKTDWTVHDRDRILDCSPDSRFIVMLRDTGCDTAFLSGKYLALDNLDWSGASLNSERAKKYLYYDGKKLRDIPFEKAKKLFDEVWKSLPKEYMEEYNRSADLNRCIPTYEEWCKEHKKSKDISLGR